MTQRGFLRLAHFRNPRLRLKSRPSISLLDAMKDEQLFARWFKDRSTWKVWRVVIRALFGLSMSKSQCALFTELTGRDTPPNSAVREAWLVKGRRAGGSFIAALIGVYLAAFVDYRRFLSPGERGVVMILAADRRQARTIMRYATALLENVPMLARMIVRAGMESIDLSNYITIEIHTASFRSVRGYTVVAALLDEVAYWRNEESANPDREIIDAIRPAMATIPNALLLGISSPYSRRGVLWEAYDQHYGRNRDSVLVFKGPTQLFNPTVPQHVIDDAYLADPSAAAAEFGGEFRSDLEAFLDQEWIAAAVQEGLHEIQPQPGTSYTAFCDPSGGSQDAMTLGIAHSEGKRLILDVCRAWRPPFNPQHVCKEIAATLKSYGLSHVIGDRYSAEWVVSAFRENNVYYEASTRSKSEIYLECLPLFATSSVQLLDNRQLLTELRGLERRTGQARDVVDHAPRSHDDLANSACGALLLAVQRQPINMADAEVVTSAAARQGLNEHIVSDLGYIDTMADPDGPWKL